jgi:hypothetical protein
MLKMVILMVLIEMTWSQISGNRWTGDYLAINKLMPTIALHYIKRVSNPW